jgi:hypothetical protein
MSRIPLQVLLYVAPVNVLKFLQEEHEAIIRKRENPDSELTWSEYKSMTFTFQVTKNQQFSRNFGN